MDYSLLTNKMESLKNARNIKGTIKVVEWEFAEKCNYRCSYCSSKIGSKRYPPLLNHIEFLDKLSRFLKGDWLLHLGGAGEPFLQPNFLEIIKESIRKGYYIGLITNFSRPLKDIKKFCPLTDKCQIMLKQAVISFKLSARSYFRLIKVSRTIADLAGKDEIETCHIAEALQYRPKIEKQE